MSGAKDSEEPEHAAPVSTDQRDSQPAANRGAVRTPQPISPDEPFEPAQRFEPAGGRSRVESGAGPSDTDQDTKHRATKTTVLTTLGTIVAIATGVITLKDEFVGDGGSKAQEVVVRTARPAIPKLQAIGGHFEESVRTLDWLQQHDGETVELSLLFSDLGDGNWGESGGGPRLKSPWLYLFEECFPSLPAGEYPSILSGCSGTQLLLTGPETDDSGLSYSGGVRINGYFAVNVFTELHQGIATVGLKPLTYEDAKNSV